MNRYTPVPPIKSSTDQTSDVEEENSSSSDSEDEDFQLTNKEYEDIKPEMKKRMHALSELDAFANKVKNC